MPLCLNIGSGQRPFKTSGDHVWINIDINPKWNPDIVADGAKLDMFSDSSVDLIVSHHNLEHYGCGEAEPMLREANRVLKSGGKLLVFVPHMLVLCKAWIAGRIDTQIFMTNVYGAYMNDEADRHKWAYSPSSLTSLLRSNGTWTGIGPTRTWEIPGADIARDWWILGMEAVK